MTRDCTIVIAARNAAATIARAVASARAEGCARIVLIDHASTDATVALARTAGGETLEIVAAPVAARLGAVRQLGLEAVRTEFGMWLDADDEIVAGRVPRLIDRLVRDEADLAYDEVDLHDGTTGGWVRRLPIPAKLDGPGIALEFERNYLPAVGFPAFRTARVRALAFDPSLHGAEDVDLLLRAIAADHRVALVREVGYRQFAYPDTLSRDIDNQRAMLRTALRKHAPADIEARFGRAGLDARALAWSMVTFLTLRGDLSLVLERLETLPAGGRRDFHEGTALAALARPAEALGLLERAVHARAVPECFNNLGVVLAALGRGVEASAMFRTALGLFPRYADAAANLTAEAPTRLTLLPFRDEPIRDDYT